MMIPSNVSFSIRHGNLSTVKSLIEKYNRSDEEWLVSYNLLVEALKYRRSAVAKLLLSNGAMVNTDSSKLLDSTPLHIAIENDDVEIVELLLERGAAINVTVGKRKCTPLYEAIYRNRIEMTQLLLKYAALVDIPNNEEETPLGIAVERNYVELVQLLLQNGANVNSVGKYCKRIGSTPLHVAAMKGREEIVKLLLSCGASVDATAADLSTPLHLAVNSKCGNVVNALLSKGASVNAKTADALTPLHIAVKHSCKDVAELLLKMGAWVNARTAGGITPLHVAVRSGDAGIVELLSNCGADMNAKDEESTTPLHIAVEMGRIDLVSFLFDRGADINMALVDSRTPLHQAIGNYHINIIELLLRNGADANAEVEDHRNPLHIIVEDNSPDVPTRDLVELLLNNGACVNAKMAKSVTPLHIAIKKNRNDVVQLLLERGAAVDSEDEDGNTALCLAVQNACRNLFEEVMKYHPDVNNRSNQNALSLATERDDDKEEIIKALLQYGFRVKPEDADDRYIVSCVVRNGFLETAETIFKHNTNSVQEFDLTPLHLATIHKQIEVAKVLLKYGADVNARDSAKRTPIYFATANADFRMFELLLDHNAIVKDTCELLDLAAKSGALEIVKKLLERGCAVDGRDAKGRTALHNTNFYLEPLRMTPYFPRFVKSCSLRLTSDIETHRQIAEHLLLNGADVDARDNNRDTPLHIAAREGSNGIVDVFLKYGGDVNSRDRYGDTALYSSVRYGNLDLSRLLLREGAKAYIKTNSSTPLHIAVKAGDAEHVKLLLDYDAHVDASCKDGTALHVATLKGDLRLVKLLHDHCADVNAQCKLGTPLHIAVAIGRTDLVKNLLKWGSDINITNQDDVTPLERARTGSSNTVCTSVDKCYFKGTFGFLLAHVIKMTAANLYVSERNLRYLETDSLVEYFGKDSRWISKLTEYLSKCEEEVELMKGAKIGGSSVSYSDILSKSSRQIVRLCANATIVGTLSSESYLNAFPIYGSMIWSKFEKGKTRRKLEGESRRLFFSNYVSELPDICIDRILAYLTDGDLALLIRSFCDKIEGNHK